MADTSPGYNHSGKLGEINFLNGPMGLANAQRMLDYIRVIAEFISQPEYANVVGMFGIVNEGTCQAFFAFRFRADGRGGARRRRSKERYGETRYVESECKMPPRMWRDWMTPGTKA